jgi:D-arabinose 1-dehydrogenase-like Zn-dependent alcohol dehydrogenase
MEIMNPFGRIIPLEIDWNDLVIPFGPFLVKELSFTGSCAATADHMNAMLKFAADNGVRAMVESFPMTKDGISSAIEKLENGSLRYRAVLVSA